MNKRTAQILAMALVLCTTAVVLFFLVKANTAKQEIVTDGDIILATTTSTKDSGLLDYLLPFFEAKAKIKVKVISVGSGEAISMAKNGDCDVLLAHSRAAEDELVSSGFGIDRKDVMYNFFYLVGPKTDPAKIGTTPKAADAFKLISSSKSPFISRSDKSGTNTKELSIWKLAGIVPTGNSWYKEAGLGMLDTLTMASELQAYTISDSATWSANESKLDMKIILEGDTALFNPYGVIQVNPEKYPNVHKKSAKAFSDFLISTEGQRLIGEYKKNGTTLFVASYKGK